MSGAEAYRGKIVTREELHSLIGERPRERTVIMCHGTFDLVHPGHIRHLTYAKSKAAVLVASVTADVHVSKADYRPFVPQDLRALNLAALEMVDHVIVDPNPTPLESLAYLQPDLFAKGYDYTDGGVHPSTRKEMDVIESYGGEMLFTPGDVVYSSSALIEARPPNLGLEKLLVLLESEGLGFDDLRGGLEACQGLRAHVVGDTIVDTYVYCSPIGSSTSKTPTLSVKFEEQTDFIGGAAIVAKHLRAAGAEVSFSTMLGSDDLGAFVRAELALAGIEVHASVEPARPTTRKSNYFAGGYRLLKVDVVDSRRISDRTLEALCTRIAEVPADLVVCSDFRHGIFGKETIPRLVEAIPEGPLRVADSQVASRWGNILDFVGFDLITPNEKEARFALGDQDSVVRPLSEELFRRSGCRLLVLKLGDRGLLAYREHTDAHRNHFAIDAFADRVVDAVGAGDSLLAYAGLSYRATGSAVIACVLGALAAGVAVEQEGNQPVGPEQVLDKLARVERLLALA